MPTNKLEAFLTGELEQLARDGTKKGAESVIVEVLAATDTKGPRYRLRGEGERAFLRMNANGYLGLSQRAETVQAEEVAVRRYGTGPQAVRFISGTFAPHVALEERLAAFHGRDGCMIFSSAYAAVMGILPSLIGEQTIVVSDELNHNCIINAMRLSRPAERVIVPHLDVAAVERALDEAAGRCRRAIVVSDGVFSMRGDSAPLSDLAGLVRERDRGFAEGCLLVVDDSHGVGVLGETGRGTEEYEGVQADLLVATLGKAFGVNGGYVAGSAAVIEYLREKSPFYVYSNPITPGEAAAAKAAIDLLDGPVGRALLERVRALTARFEAGLSALGFETIAGPHPVVPLMVRDTGRTRALVQHLRDHDVLATGLTYPVVPRGDEEIRFQISAEHTEADIDQALAALQTFGAGR